MSDEQRIEWLPEQIVEAVADYLDSDEGKGILEFYSQQTLAQSDRAVFERDARRRLDCPSGETDKWVASIFNSAGWDENQYLTLVEPLAQYGVSIEDLHRFAQVEYYPGALVEAYQRLSQSVSVDGLPPGITNTKGWSEADIRAKLEKVKKALDWENTTGSARKWWEAFENENKDRIALVLRMAEELQNRRATATEFFLAYVYSNTDNIQANLHYLDYTRLKKDFERRKLEAAQSEGAGKPADKPLLNEFSSPPARNAVGITDPRGWDQDRIRTRLEEIKPALDWANTTGSAHKWWTALEKEKEGRLQVVLRLAEELRNRSATITEFFLAQVYSNMDDLQGNLLYLDYTRLKKEEEKKKRQQA